MLGALGREIGLALSQHPEYPSWVWLAFNGFVLLMLLLDLGVFHRKSRSISVREAILWSLFWISLGLGLNGLIYVQLGSERGLEFLAGYLLEKSLSVDNLFVFLLIFSYFKVPAVHQHRVLFMGILGAIVMRASMIWAGVALIEHFHWVLYIFGLILIFSGIKMGFSDDEQVDPEQNRVVRWVRGFFPMTAEYRGERFFVRENGLLHATPLLVVLVALETTDVIFALDSIPAVFGVTQDPFIIYSSNIMAILGLRALYFALAGLMEYFHYLRYGLGLILVFIGAKMLVEDYVHVSTPVALGVIGTVLFLSVAVSLLIRKPAEPPEAPGNHEEHEEHLEASEE